jgi:hypothetical protein
MTTFIVMMLLAIGAWAYFDEKANNYYTQHNECVRYIDQVSEDWRPGNDHWFQAMCNRNNPNSLVSYETRRREEIRLMADLALYVSLSFLAVMIVSTVVRWIVTGRAI